MNAALRAAVSSLCLWCAVLSARGMPDSTTVPPALVSGDAPVAESPRATKSPGTAIALSAVVPGAGQFYNESYWKVPVFLGLGAYFIAELVSNQKKYADYRDQYSESLTETPGGDPRLLQLREFYKDQRDTFGWYFLILYVVNLIDAYVDASLYDFDAGADLGTVGASGPSVHLTLRLRL